MPVTAPEPLRIHLSWLIRLRFGLCLVQIGVALAAAYGFALSVRLPLVVFVVLTTLVTNLIAASRQSRIPTVKPHHPAMLVALDIALFTLLLHASGGPENPFGFIYLVPIALAAIILPARWMWTLVALTLIGSGALFWLRPEDPHAGHHGHDMQAYALHMQGMWVALGVASIFIVGFVGRLGNDLRQRDAELAAERVRSERAARLASLTTLAAGAAHELASPLATIAVLSQELVNRLQRADVPPALGEDARLIRQEVARCRAILDRLDARTGQARGDGVSEERLLPLLEAIVSESPGRERVKPKVDPAWVDRVVVVPRAVVVTAVRAILQNAVEASAGPVELQAELDRNAGGALRLVISVRDQGPGMDETTLEHAREPFFTTKSEGMGLGLFLASTAAEQLGGELDLGSAPGQGTVARWAIPVSEAPN